VVRYSDDVRVEKEEYRIQDLGDRIQYTGGVQSGVILRIKPRNFILYSVS